MKRKVLCWILGAVMVTALLAGCQSGDGAAGNSGGAQEESADGTEGSGGVQESAGGSEESAEDTAENDSTEEADPDFPTTASKDGKYDPAIQISTVRSISDMMQTKGIDKKADVLEDNLWYRDFRDIMGIEVVNQWSVPDAQYVEKMNAQIAANDLPDFFKVNATQLKMLVDYGMAYDMTEVFAEHASDFTMEMMEADNYVSLEQATIDGKLYALPGTGGNRDHSNFWWVRKDWMDNLGIEEPQTMDELIDMCRRFVTDDPDGNGIDDTIGMGLQKELFGSNIGLNAFGEGYHAYLDKNAWVEVDGQLEYGGIQPEAKEALAALAAMYEEGILDKEFIVKDSSKVSEEIIAGKVGVFGGNHGMAFWPLQDVRNNNPEADFVALSIVSNDDEKPRTMLNGSAGDFFVVNANCENPEAVVKLYNYFYLKDLAISPEFDEAYHGHVDSDPNWPVDEAYFWAPLWTGYPMQNLFIHTGVEACMEENDMSLADIYWISDNLERNQAFLDGDENQWGTSRWSGPGDYTAQGRIHYYELNDMFNQNGYIGSTTDAQVQYNSTLDQLRLETLTKIIMGEVPIDEFDNFVEQWKMLGGDEITAEINANR